LLLRSGCGRTKKAHCNAAKRNCYPSQHTDSLTAKCALEFSSGDHMVLLGIEELSVRLS
jgi:hypothetical protein